MIRLRSAAAVLALASLVACSAAQQAATISAATTLAQVASANSTTAAALVKKGQAICGDASGLVGTVVTTGAVALANAAGVPVAVTNAASSDVAAACAALGKVPGALPPGVDAAAVPIASVATTLASVL